MDATALAVALSTAALFGGPPPGYQQAAAISPPILAYYSKRLYDGEAVLMVERYFEADGTDLGAFLRNLGLGPDPKPVKRKAEGKVFEVYEGLKVESFTRIITPEDLYADALGSGKPPRLSLFESARFPVGGEAYRFYRCRKLGAWGVLARYRRLRAKGEDLYKFETQELDTATRKVLSACFGQGFLYAMTQGQEVPDVPKPSGYRLKIMAREEWAYGASKKVELECVHLRPVAGGFYVLRFRAPKSDFKAERAAFDRFLAAFQPAP
ncbi:MAG TPA: hypothetical protein DCM05_11985 [Elusimicrobia bacterium]|nr:hypothetical protein [Elusimicrobiota bacterium]